MLAVDRDNNFSWTASLADTTDEELVTFDQKTEILKLTSLPELKPKERIRVNLRRKFSLITSLRKLAADSVVSNTALDEEKIEAVQIPR